ncbi:PREDICTED: triadin-like [Hipposideros armiger]|uniref:Triadin-like n=1 Tax=Hipposideros armiger TaxID=186990 RepID=A0A8B7QFC5_HIPAR|nr:PREDICTED: triadin-like [Hipposideros armiger]
MIKEKPGKTSSVLKDKEPAKGKEVKLPTSLKEKGKEAKEVKPKPPQPQVKKEEKPEEDRMKQEKTVSHGKPEEKVVKQVKVTTIEKTVRPKPANQTKPALKETQEITESGKKKLEKSEKESKEKPARVSREDTKDVPASKKAKEEAEDVSSTQKQKSPISFFQCVYLNGHNGYGFQFPFTSAHRPAESSGPPGSPGQKEQGQ